jgi:hypothetical protein
VVAIALFRQHRHYSLHVPVRDETLQKKSWLASSRGGYPTLALVSSGGANDPSSRPQIPIIEANLRIISQRKDDRTLELAVMPWTLRLLPLLTGTSERRVLLLLLPIAFLLIPSRCDQSASATTLQVLTTAARTLSSSHMTWLLNGAIKSARDCAQNGS